MSKAQVDFVGACGSGGATIRLGGAVYQVHRGDAIAGKPAPTLVSEVSRQFFWKIPAGCSTQYSAKHTGEGARAAIAQIRRYSRNGFAVTQAHHCRQQACLLAPFDKADSGLLAK